MTEKLHFANLFWNRLNQNERKMALESSELNLNLSEKPLADDCFGDGNIIEHTERITDGRMNLQKLIAVICFFGAEHGLFKKVEIGYR